MKHLKSHVRHDDPEIMSISHIHVLLLSSAISLIVSLTLPSWSPVLVLKLPVPLVFHCEQVTRHYNRDSRTRYAVEQPDLAGLMKIMGRKYHWTGGRRRANGHKTAEENFWWACGFCFFERRKKSTVKAHVVQQVCQKSTERKESSQNASNRRIARCPSYDTAMDSFGPYSASSWKNTQSV